MSTAEVEVDDVHDVTDYQWPDPPAPEAFHGIAGEAVEMIGPHTEADPVALLASILVGFGNLIGRNAFFRVEGTRHYLNLFANLVGPSGVGRKGTSWGRAAQLLGPLDEAWHKGCVIDGLSSGEGLIASVRDPVFKKEPVKSAGKVTGYEDVMTDEGVSDKRALVQASEFGGLLKVLNREGNTLSVILRQAWDSGKLRVVTKSPIVATDAHVSILGHVTRDDVIKHLNATDTANGFANRFIWLCVRRSKYLPHGGSLHPDQLEPLRRRLAPVVTFASGDVRLRRSDAADELWEDAYPELSRGKPGLLGTVCNRAEAQVLRLSCLYALLDGTEVIGEDHLMAALALWDYSERSAAFVFGRSLGKPDHEKILTALQQSPGGLTSTEIYSGVFAFHKKAATIKAMLGDLLAEGMVRQSSEATGGRPSQRWFAVDPGAGDD